MIVAEKTVRLSGVSVWVRTRDQTMFREKQADADHAGEEADPVGFVRAAPGMDGDDDSREAGEDGESLGPGHALAEQKRREQRDNHGREEDEDVEGGQGEVAQGDDDADIVAEVEGGAEDLRAEFVRQESAVGRDAGDRGRT